jgi:hypothetical protein
MTRTPGRRIRFLAGVLAAFALGALLPGPAGAGAWLQEAGTAYVRLSSGYLATRERFDEDGDRVQWDTSGGGFRNARYRDIALAAYAEAGLARDWTVVLAGGWSHLQARQPSAEFETYGFGDVTVGVKRSLGRWSRSVASAGGYLTFPTGYDTGDYPALGSNVTDLSVVGSAGTSGSRAWGTAEVEYRIRGGGFRNQVRGAVGGGWNPAPRLGLRAEIRGTRAVGAAAEGNALRFDPAAVDPSVLEAAGTVSVSVGGGIAVEGEVRTALAGENTLAGTRWSLAVATSPAWRWPR